MQQSPPTHIWEERIKAFEDYFSEAFLMTAPKEVKLSPCETITDLPKFISTSLATVKKNIGNQHFISHMARLNKLKKSLTNNKKING